MKKKLIGGILLVLVGLAWLISPVWYVKVAGLAAIIYGGQMIKDRKKSRKTS